MNNGVIFGITYHGVRRLPRSVSYAIGHIGSSIVARFAPESTSAIVENLRPVFPDESDAALRRRALETYRSYTRDAIDFLRAIEDPRVEQSFDIGDLTRERAAWIYSQGRGAILVTAHFGNWEAGSLLMARALRLPLTVVAMREPDETVNKIRSDIRARIGIETIEVRQSLDTPLKIRAALAQNRFVALLVDRHLGRDRVPVTLFGRRAWFLRTPLLIAALTGAPLAVSSIERSGPGRFVATMGPPITIPNGASKDEWIPQAAQQIADEIAERVRARPECWYHFYRYWDAQRDDYRGLD
ncbi:MAG TPA: lysophospholipid acyltransferase family protein [Vicinamibacterales bacterium]|nr:lysophospholipid acyltransferase family protein [Vicinamibacterales bacterium]